MKIIDLTNMLTGDRYNYYCFNGAIVNNENNIFILVYRIIKYKLEIQYHPWKIWNSHYDKFRNPELVLQIKYKNCNGKAYSINLDNQDKIPNLDEFDSTGLAILKYSEKESKFHLIHNINNIFNNEMNQDARIIKIHNNEFVLTYNSWSKNGENKTVEMKTRKLKIDTNKIYLSDELNMFKNMKVVEKNCVYDHNMNIIYSIYPDFTIIAKQGLIKKKMIFFDKLVELYQKNNIYISVSTPPIKFEDNYLALGHIKIKYKNTRDIYPFKCFMDSIDWSKIIQHGSFIYFMFFYLFDQNYNIIKISNPFIPQLEMNHLPYLLAFPTGITKIGNEYGISYGEGDCKCKILILSKKEINDLLVKELDLGFYFLTSKNVILHYGYFNELNCGDDAFVEIFKYLHKKHYPQFEISFTNSEIKPSDLLIVGGGDVINPFFTSLLKKVIKEKKIAVGIGLPYLEEKDDLKLFDSIILRNKRDYGNLKKYFNLSYYPDLAFLLPKIFGKSSEKPIIDTSFFGIKHIGFCLSQTFYNKDFEMEYEDFIKNLCICMRHLISNKCIIHLIPFCINKYKKTENDLIIMHKIKNILKSDSIIIEFNESYNASNYVYLTYQKISQMDFVVCTRLHAHIFSTIHKIPFVSLSCSRKCTEYMHDIELMNNLYKLDTNKILIPINFDGFTFYKFLIEKFKNIPNIIKKLNYVNNSFQMLMEDFEKCWRKLIYQYLDNSKKIQLYPPISHEHDHPISPPFCPTSSFEQLNSSNKINSGNSSNQINFVNDTFQFDQNNFPKYEEFEFKYQVMSPNLFDENEISKYQSIHENSENFNIDFNKFNLQSNSQFQQMIIPIQQMMIPVQMMLMPVFIPIQPIITNMMPIQQIPYQTISPNNLSCNVSNNLNINNPPNTKN